MVYQSSIMLFFDSIVKVIHLLLLCWFCWFRLITSSSTVPMHSNLTFLFLHKHRMTPLSPCFDRQTQSFDPKYHFLVVATLKYVVAHLQLHLRLSLACTSLVVDSLPILVSSKVSFFKVKSVCLMRIINQFRKYILTLPEA